METPEVEEDEEESSEVIRCVCGHNKDDVEGMDFIECEKCNVWQHNVCVGILGQDEVPDQYFCEQCAPENHQELLAAIEKGEPIWEERAEEAKRRKNEKKGSKKNKRSRVSEVKPSGTVAASSSPAPAASQASGTKRKFEEETPQVS